MKVQLSKLILTHIWTATTMFNDTGATGRRRNRERWGLLIKYEGETLYRQSGRQIVSNVKQITLIPRGIQYEWVCTKAGHFTALEFDAIGEGDEILSIPVTNGEQIAAAVRRLEYDRMLKRPNWEMESLRDAYSILLRAADGETGDYLTSGKKQILTPVLEYITKHYDREITNDQLAALSGYSAVYVRTLFTRLYGISPLGYARQLRIRKAMELLCSDYGSLTDMALSLGYSSLYDFSRDFKKHTGIAPSRYGK